MTREPMDWPLTAHLLARRVSLARVSGSYRAVFLEYGGWSEDGSLSGRTSLQFSFVSDVSALLPFLIYFMSLSL